MFRNSQICIVAVYALIFGVSGAMERDLGTILVGAVGCLVLLVIGRPLYNWASVRKSVRLMKEDRRLFEPHHYELSNDMLTAETQGSETRIPIAQIHAIHETSSHIFIYLGAYRGHVIPKRSVSDEVVTELRELQSRLARQSELG